MVRQWQVRDVMTRKVVTATSDTPIGQLAELLADHRISAVPIVDSADRVLGVASEADLLNELAAVGSDRAPRRRLAQNGARAARPLTAQRLLNTRSVTVSADATLADAATTMLRKKIKRLLVTDDTGRLLGIISHADVLRPITRPDTDIRDDIVEQVLQRMWIDPTQVHVDVRHGVVTLTGTVGRRTTASIAVRLTRRVPGVLDIVDRIQHTFDDTRLARSRIGRTHPFSAEPFHPERSDRRSLNAKLRHTTRTSTSNGSVGSSRTFPSPHSSRFRPSQATRNGSRRSRRAIGTGWARDRNEFGTPGRPKERGSYRRS